MMRCLSRNYLLAAVFFLLQECSSAERSLFVANTRGGSEVFLYGLESGNISVVIPDGVLESPDHLVAKDGDYYISSGADTNTSAIVRFSIDDDEITVGSFAVGGGLKRPYGFDFYEDTLYVASFMTDQILMYSADTGEYMGVFAEGNATEEGLCNGPNQIDIHDGMLYMTTQGSFIDEAGDLNYAFASQTVVYDLETGMGSVFIPQPDPDPEGFGFVSMLGLKIGCDDESVLDDDCTVYTTDFAGGLRIYAFSTQELIDSQSTSFVPGTTTGSLTLGDDGLVYVTGFASEESGAILAFIPDTDPTNGSTLTVVYQSAANETLARPIGILFDSGEDSEDPSMPPPPMEESDSLD